MEKTVRDVGTVPLGVRSRTGGPEEGGSAMILALFFTILTAGIVLSGSLLQRASRQSLQTDFRLNSQALQFARAGMTEAVNWFRRQTVQPVTEFVPVLDRNTVPQILDTEDPDIGIVRQFRIEGRIHGRYEVWRKWDSDPDSERLAWRESCEATDMGHSRGTGADGGAWRITSIGYVFELNDEDKAFDEHPNRLLATRLLESEILRRSLAPPGQAALSITDGNNAHINTYGRIIGGTDGAGIYYPSGSGTPTVGPRNQNRVTGTPPLSPSPDVDCSVEAVFGVSVDELRSSADMVVTDSNNFPDVVPNNSTVFVDVASITFDSSRPLRGTGLVYIKGNVSLIAGNNSVFNGVLYVDGQLTVRAPSVIEGAVICTGNFTLQGSGDYATIRYNDEVLNALRREIGQYRFLGSYRTLRAAR